MLIKISGKWIKHKFNCSYNYIINVCKGSCCQGSNKILISLLPKEEKYFIDNGYEVKSHLLQPNKLTNKCPFKNINGLCNLHKTLYKPFGCIASPFTLNKKNTLIIRYRYLMMKCYGNGEPAYKTFKESLNLIFGKENTLKIVRYYEKGNGDLLFEIKNDVYDNLKYLDTLKNVHS